LSERNTRWMETGTGAVGVGRRWIQYNASTAASANLVFVVLPKWERTTTKTGVARASGTGDTQERGKWYRDEGTRRDETGMQDGWSLKMRYESVCATGWYEVWGYRTGSGARQR
jgi:hypothetical protein